jgi:hypothetical protein
VINEGKTWISEKRGLFCEEIFEWRGKKMKWLRRVRVGLLVKGWDEWDGVKWSTMVKEWRRMKGRKKRVMREVIRSSEDYGWMMKERVNVGKLMNVKGLLSRSEEKRCCLGDEDEMRGMLGKRVLRKREVEDLLGVLGGRDREKRSVGGKVMKRVGKVSSSVMRGGKYVEDVDVVKAREVIGKGVMNDEEKKDVYRKMRAKRQRGVQFVNEVRRRRMRKREMVGKERYEEVGVGWTGNVLKVMEWSERRSKRMMERRMEGKKIVRGAMDVGGLMDIFQLMCRADTRRNY